MKVEPLKQLEDEMKRELSDLWSALKGAVELIGTGPESIEPLHAEAARHLGTFTSRVMRMAYRLGVRSVQQSTPAVN